jgi:hypothetical protein
MIELRKKLTLLRNELFWRGAIRIVGVSELLMATLLIGLIGEGYFQNSAWVNTFLNGAVWLGKIFAGFYILYVATILTIFAYILLMQIKDRQLYNL